MSCRTGIQLVIVSLVLHGAGAVILASDPTATTGLDTSGQPTTLRARGSIDRINRQAANIIFFADAPFWGPARYGAGQACLWPKDTAFVLFIPPFTPISVDGKKASYGQLAVGQKVDVEYNLYVSGNTGCFARRVNAHSSGGATEPLTVDRLIGHWRYLGPGAFSDVTFSRDGTFNGQIGVAGRKSPIEFGGKWSVAGDTINYQFTQSSSKEIKAGSTDHDKVLALTKDYFVVENRRHDQHRYARLPQ